ncbi:MAG: UDP-N-acetylglucosamine--N-acetylmuramyl-(pentapeptide) pyrophosphoryl-undecaprenol N-acetylglucosamine transferase [Fimbriimonadaceae bacterium]
MRLIVTGGGTGGHVFPALEIANAARDRGAFVAYFGSHRGQEGAASARLAIPFVGFKSEPIYSLRSLRGWAGLIQALRSARLAKKELVRIGADVVFSTGGYSAAPVVQAARSLGIPYVIHEANSAPGRSNRLFVSRATHFTCVFRRTQVLFPSAVRTGQPIRPELRHAAEHGAVRTRFVTVIGGSQGSAFLNRTVPEAAALLKPPARFLHATGPQHILTVKASALPPGYEAVPFIDAPELAEAYATSMVVVGRSGGALAEFAVFRLPSVLVPLPTSADDHQAHNAKEFVEMGAATLVPEAEATPPALAAAIEAWLADEPRRAAAAQALAEWDVPNATAAITDLVMGSRR